MSKGVPYRGEAATVTWQGRLCIHVGECGRAEGDLFVKGRDPWCDPDVVAADDVAAVVRRCPTGALSFELADGVAETPPERNVATVTNDGPVYLHGDLHIAGAPEDAPGTRFRAALCRCGLSKNKPFCDNSHREGGFRDGGAVGRVGEAAIEAGGPLEVRPQPNGPVLVTGNLTIRAASGREAWHGTKAALCRCGQSSTKPFCDGTHKEIGFTAP